jgi:hypothetical protein
MQANFNQHTSFFLFISTTQLKVHVSLMYLILNTFKKILFPKLQFHLIKLVSGIVELKMIRYTT